MGVLVGKDGNILLGGNEICSNKAIEREGIMI